MFTRSTKPLLTAALLAAGSIAPLAQAQPDRWSPENSPSVSVQPGQMGLIRASTKRGLIESRPPGGAPLASLPQAATDPCNNISTNAATEFTGGTYAVQAGFSEGEGLAQVYYFDPADAPITIRAIEQIFLTRAATVETTTQLDFFVWDGLPNQSPVVLFEDTDGSVLPHLVMPPGTNGTLYSLLVDSEDSTQYRLAGEAVLLNGVPKRRFSVGVRIRQHNDQGPNNPCTTGPIINRNAFPATDNTTSTCGNYTQLNFAAGNYLLGLNCGPLGCPPFGGWAAFSSLQADVSVAGAGCATGCRPRGDWMLRVRWETSECAPAGGACCLPNGICRTLGANECANQGGVFQGLGVNCAEIGCPIPSCPVEYNNDGILTLDDVSDFITDFYSVPAIPGGIEVNSPTYPFFWIGFGIPCELAPDAPEPYLPNAYRQRGYRVAYSSASGNSGCPFDPTQNFPNLDHLADFITGYYLSFGVSCD